MSKPIISVAGIVLLSMSCVETRTIANPEFCANALGDQTCAERYPDGSRPYCVVEECLDDFYGCFPYEPAPECASPCGLESTECVPGETTVGAESETENGNTTEGSSGSETGSETGTSSTTGPQPCTGNEDCGDPAAPFCVPSSGECVACDGTADPDAACAGLDADEPLCVNGACVECTPENPLICDERLLLCDGNTNSCVTCVEHTECGSGACELAVGTCFPPGEVVHVDGDGGQDYESIEEAVAAVPAGMHGVIVVHELDGGVTYQTPGTGLRVDGGKRIALLAAPGESPVIQGTGGNPGLRVEGAGTVLYMDGLGLVGNTMGLGLHVDDALTWADRSRIVQNTGGGVLAEAGAELTLRNCFVGGGTPDVNAIALDGSTLAMVYTTAGGGTVLGGRARALYCQGATIASVRNSILVSADPMPEVECPGATLTDSATEADVGNLNIMWFNGYATGNFSLTGAGAATFADLAEWQAGDPPIDIDGDPRPAVNRSPDHAGADVP